MTVRAAITAIALVVSSVLGTFSLLEGWARVTVSSAERVLLPHVGLDWDAEYRLQWLAAHAARGGAEHEVMRHDPLLGWRPRPSLRTRLVLPGSYDVPATTNAEGLRGPYEVAHVKRPGRTRIAVFGGSQTFGTGVRDEETYPARLAARLHDIEVLNFGVPGYGTDQMVLALERDGLGYAPDVVVLGFAFYHMRRNVQTFRFYAKPKFVLGDGGALRLVGTPVPTRDAVLAAPPPATWPFVDLSVLLRWAWLRVQERRDLALVRTDGPAWPVTKALLRRFIRGVRGAGGQIVLLNVDSAPDPTLQPALARVAREAGATFVDAAPTLRRIGEHERLRLRNDSHWNARAQSLIAAELAAGLCEQGLVEELACESG